MSRPVKDQGTIPPEPVFDSKGERIMAIGQYHRKTPWVGLFLGLIVMGSSIYFLITKRDVISQSLPWMDIVLLIGSIYTIYYSIRELMLFRFRSVTLTASRLYGHDGRAAFDMPLNDIRSVTEETTKSFFAGTQIFIVVKAKGDQSVKLEQLKEMKILEQAIQDAREKARQIL